MNTYTYLDEIKELYNKLNRSILNTLRSAKYKYLVNWIVS